MKILRHILFFVLGSVFLPSAHADKLPNLVCQEVNNDTILNSTFDQLGESKIKELYKFNGGKLFVSSTETKEELIGNITRVRGLKYQAGDKTIVFFNAKYLEATAVDHGNLFIKISRLQCTEI